MRVMEKGDLAAAERALASVEGSARDRVIARFRRAECLSRLGRHDEAIADARAALRDGSDETAPWVWLVHCLAEAGPGAEIPPPPPRHAEELAPIRAGYEALERIRRGERGDADAATSAVLDARHAPLYSLALRVLESQRLRSPQRWPDLPSVWYAHECAYELKCDKVAVHPEPPSAASPAKAVRWLRLHWSCADYRDLVASLRALPKPPDGLDECELEQHLAFGRIDDAARLAERLAAEAGDAASGELCVDLARIARLRGETAPVSSFPGWLDARGRLKPTIAWLDLCAALLEDRPLDARPLADRVADPSHREFVESALVRWSR